MRTCVYLPCRNIHVYVSLDSYICSGMHRLERRQWNCCQLALHPISSPWTFFFLHFLCFSPFTSGPRRPGRPLLPPRCDPPSSITSEETDAQTSSASRGRTDASPPTRKVPQRQLSWFPVTSESVFSHSDPVKESAEMNWWRTGLFIPRSPDLSLPHRPGILNWQQHILKCVIAPEAADTQAYLLFIFNLPW